MIMNTYSKESIETFICEYFHITQEELHRLFDQIYYASTDVESVIADYVSENLADPIEYVQFYHLSRRLNGSNLKAGNNLYDVLLTPTPISVFLKEHGIEFKMGTDHLLLFHNGKLEELKQASKGNLGYLKWRMGYDKGDKDYCFNGFVFGDLLQYNDYYNSLRICPEFIYQLALIINREEMIWEYHENSKYYCLEYTIPLEKAIIDGEDHIVTRSGKTKVILEAALLRLYKYWLNGKYTFDHDNIILRLADTDTMQEEYFVQAEELE